MGMTFDFAVPSPRVLVVGDLMIDHYLWGHCERISPEAPVPVLEVREETSVLGGAGNVVNNLVALGARVTMATVIGDDDAGRQSIQMLEAAGVGTEGVVVQPGRRSSRKSRLMGGHQQVLRYDKESRDQIKPESERALIAHLEALLVLQDVVLLSDYGKGVLTMGVCQAIIQRCRQLDIKVLVDPKGTDYSRYRGAYTVTPNRREAALATGMPVHDQHTLEEALYWLRAQLQLDVAIITLSEDGIAYLDETTEVHNIPTRAKDVFDVTGAGDTVLATLGYALANGWAIGDACRLANHAAAVVVSKVGSATATLAEIEDFYRRMVAPTPRLSVKDRADMARGVRALQADGKRVVFTNGCFDVLHLGHVQLLEAAKSFGDILIVGLNDDESVRTLKGPERPINPQHDRAYLLASLRCVDYVVVFGEPTPYELIDALRPDVLVKGADYTREQVVGHDLVDEVRLVDLVEGKSTTSIVNRIKGRVANL